MNAADQYRISSPLYLRVRTPRRRGQVLSVREHLPPDVNDDPSLPLVVITYHPGFAAGSYEDRDYFELLTPLLFERCTGNFRLRAFTVNHPGYDLPDSYKVDRFDMDTYSIRYQPAIIEQVLRWLVLDRFAGEKEILLIPYGHSMGGVALARTNTQRLLADTDQQGCRIQVQKVLSAPAFVLQENLKRNLSKVMALKALKHTVGRAPLYERITQALFNNLAPIVYRHDASNYRLNPECTFPDFRQYNPFVLLDQGLELLKLSFNRERTAALLDGSHLILSTEDGMVDSAALRAAAEHANAGRSAGRGAAVRVHTVASSHNAERDDPHLIRESLCTIVHSLAEAG
ncbi:MAG: hypothetical protein ACK2UN_17055 [Candidatus Promineifilaceae bacterium]